MQASKLGQTDPLSRARTHVLLACLLAYLLDRSPHSTRLLLLQILAQAKREKKDYEVSAYIRTYTNIQMSVQLVSLPGMQPPQLHCFIAGMSFSLAMIVNVRAKEGRNQCMASSYRSVWAIERKRREEKCMRG